MSIEEVTGGYEIDVDRADQACLAMSSELEEFTYGELFTAVGMLMAQLIRDSDIDSDEAFEVVTDTCTICLKISADA